MMKKRPVDVQVSVSISLKKTSVWMLTANNDPKDGKEDANDKIPDCHRYHKTCNSDIFLSAHAMTSVPECLFDKVDSQHEDERADNHDR